MSDLPELLRLNAVGAARFEVFQPSESADGRDVVFSGQLIAQMLMAAEDQAGEDKTARSIHVLFIRPGSYTKPIELDVETLQAGRTFGSYSISATQGGKLLSRSTVLVNSADLDLMRHDPTPPSEVPGPENCSPTPWQAFPGAEVRLVSGDPEIDGAPALMFWHRFEGAMGSQAANQAVLSWATCGDVIGLGIRPHRDTVNVADAHRTISTGVIGQTLHFLEPIDVTQWLLVVVIADKAAGGRVFGRGQVFTRDGALVATFEQDAMAKAAAGALDFSRSM
jgi:acyl-CoA thioesterase II